MEKYHITDSIKYVGVEDLDLDLFESQYPVPDGVTYNSYVILDEKTAIMDTVDQRGSDQWLLNVEKALDGRDLDYLVVSHMEPDHGANIARLAQRYPKAALVGNAKTFPMIKQFFDLDLEGRTLLVKEGDTLSLGRHTLQFFMAPMVHWPEVMMSYEKTEKILFSADGFGTFGADSGLGEDWSEEAARYYLNIVGKYGVQVQAALKKAAGLDIRAICPLHGPVLKEDLGFYLEKYRIWSSYEAEQKGVMIACASIHGNTAKAAGELAELLKSRGESQVEVVDLARTDVSLAVRKAFYYDRIVAAAATYDGGMFPAMESFLEHLRAKNYQKRTVGLVENGTWAPVAAKAMRTMFEGMKQILVVEPAVTIRSALDQDSRKALENLADVLTQKQ
ncbi:MAG: FprA family A-type flavoprotein [Hungatella sp.]|nr:FprA family A-type flavoprotein [Hungatella sp.]